MHVYLEIRIPYTRNILTIHELYKLYFKVILNMQLINYLCYIEVKLFVKFIK